MPGARQATNVMFGYLEGVERKDAESYARAFGRRCLKSSESCWYAVEPLWSGYLYEIHEGGPGYSFLPALAKEIDANPGGVALVPSGRRVFELTVRNGRPSARCCRKPAAARCKAAWRWCSPPTGWATVRSA